MAEVSAAALREISPIDRTLSIIATSVTLPRSYSRAEHGDASNNALGRRSGNT
jgi:hypothetical protein